MASIWRARFDAMGAFARRGDHEQVAQIARHMADGARSELDDAPAGIDLESEHGVAQACEWAKGQPSASRWSAALTVLRLSLIVQKTPSRFSHFERGLRDSTLALEQTEKRRKGGSSPKRKRWADRLAYELKDMSDKAALRQIEQCRDGFAIEYDGGELVCHLEDDAIVASLPDGTRDAIKGTSFTKRYLSPARSSDSK
jgi:hypothetical protein